MTALAAPRRRYYAVYYAEAPGMAIPFPRKRVITARIEFYCSHCDKVRPHGYHYVWRNIVGDPDGQVCVTCWTGCNQAELALKAARNMTRPMRKVVDQLRLNERTVEIVTDEFMSCYARIPNDDEPPFLMDEIHWATFKALRFHHIIEIMPSRPGFPNSIAEAEYRLAPVLLGPAI